MKKLNIKSKKRQILKSKNTKMRKNKFNLYKRIDDAIKLAHKKGMIIGPTGVGKGEIIQRLCQKVFGKKKPTVTLVVAHRILLASELMERVVKGTANKWPKVSNRPLYDRTAVHSGNSVEFNFDVALDKMWLNSSVDNTARSSKQLVDIIKTGLGLGKSQLVSSTYHSLPKVISAFEKLDMKVDLVHFDEIQNLNNDKWCKSAEKIVKVSKKVRGYTATLTEKLKTRLEPILGKVIWEMNIKEAIAIGLITMPRWIQLDILDGPKNDLGNSYLDTGVVAYYNKVQNLVNLPLKLLVHCNRTWEIRALIEPKNRILTELKKKYPDLMIAAISSDPNIGHYIDGVIYKDRMEWLNTMKEHDGHLIAFHVDILNSGIDVPGFQSSLWTSPPGSETRAIQGNGRSKRLNLTDRRNLENQVISTANRDPWVKPYNYEGVLSFTDIMDSDVNRFCELVEESREDGFIPEDIDYDNNGSSNERGKPGEDLTYTQTKMQALIKIKIERKRNKKVEEAEIKNLSDFFEKNKSLWDKLENIDEVDYVA